MSAILSTFLARTPQSAARQDRAASVMPFGDTRTTTYHPPYPLTMASGEGAWLVDVDGNRYLDLLGNYTSLVHGNAYPPIVEAAQRQLARGTAWPARNDAQVELAELLTSRVPSVEQVRFCNSGTEATMLCAYVARAVTGRRKVLMARYGYHGSLEGVQVGTLTAMAGRDGTGHPWRRGRLRPGARRARRRDRLHPPNRSWAPVALPRAPGALAAIAERARRAGRCSSPTR
ncbi:MAG: aminotransferase class III-fold pyridoxal phosphate-dependent enzyme [Acidimicrobiales bacterium]